MIIKKKIIVTGATGYIGFNFVKRYVDNFDFICFVRKSSNIEELKTFASDIIYIDNYDQINKAFADYQVSGVVHFATIKTSLLDIIDCNITFSSYLLEQAALNNVDWFINTGSYWQNCNGDKYNPANFYASSTEFIPILFLALIFVNIYVFLPGIFIEEKTSIILLIYIIYLYAENEFNLPSYPPYSLSL